MNFKTNVLNILTNRPEELPMLIQETHDKKFLMRTLSSYMPYKVGVEIECNGSLSNILNKKAEALQLELNCLQYHDDYSNSLNSIFGDKNTSMDEFCEHRICFDGWRQAVALKRLCLLLQEHCAINPTGAIHFHINTPELYYWADTIQGHNQMFKLQNTINVKFLKDFIAIKGRTKYIEQAGTDKSYFINLHQLGTIEFRMDVCSFDYNKISTQIINIQRIMRRIRASLGWEVDFKQV